MFVRRRPLLRAAVVGGGAYAIGRRTARRSAEQTQQETEQADAAPQAPGAPTAADAPDAADAAAPPTMTDELNQLAALHQQGALSDSELAAAKARLLGS